MVGQANAPLQITIGKAHALANTGRVVQGYFNYHAVPDNSWRLSTFRKEVARAWLQALRRRGQRGRMPWSKFLRIVARYLPQVRVLHPYPNQSFA